MSRVYDKGSLFAVSLNATEIAGFADRWPASGLSELGSFYAEFEKQSGDLVDLRCNGRDCERFDGEALTALSKDAQHIGEKRLGIKTGHFGWSMRRRGW